MACDAASVESLIASLGIPKVSQLALLAVLANLYGGSTSAVSALATAEANGYGKLSDEGLWQCFLAAICSGSCDAKTLDALATTNGYEKLGDRALLEGIVAEAAGGVNATALTASEVANGYEKLSERGLLEALLANACTGSCSAQSLEATAMANGYAKFSRRELMKAILAVICSNGGPNSLPVPTSPNFSLSFNGAFVLANASPTAPAGVTSAQLWTSTDGVNYSLNQTITPPTANNTSVPPPTTGTVIFGKFRWCMGSQCGPFTAPIKITANSNLFNSLISYWTFDENIASGTRNDSTASGNNLTDVNNNVASSATAIRGRAIAIAATAGMRLSHPDTAGLAAGAGVSFTIVLWARCNVQTPNVPLLTKFSGANQDFLIWQNATNNDLSWQVRNLANNASPNIDSGAAPPVGSWIQIACGYDDGLQQIFLQINAGARATAACVGVERTAANFVVGGYDDNVSTTFNGNLDELGFWHRALTTAEVSALYNGGASLAYPFS